MVPGSNLIVGRLKGPWGYWEIRGSDNAGDIRIFAGVQAKPICAVAISVGVGRCPTSTKIGGVNQPRSRGIELGDEGVIAKQRFAGRIVDRLKGAGGNRKIAGKRQPGYIRV